MAASSTDVAKFIDFYRRAHQSNMIGPDASQLGSDFLSSIQDSILTLSQTLTNKTLTSPTLTTPVFSGSPTGDGVTQWAEVSISNTEALALRATPKTLVAAPGAGKVLEFVSAQLYFDYTAAYTESSDDVAVKYTDGSGAAVSQTADMTGFVDATADTVTNILPKINAIVAKSGSENKALVLHNTGDGEWGGGNAANVIRVKVAYRVWSTGF